MSHPSQMDFIGRVKAKHPGHFENCRVLEIGSYNVNGSVRKFFSGCDYVGIDVAPGRDVDIVCLGHEFKAETPFDTVISCSTMEHNPFWKETMANMLTLCRPGGLIVMTCASTGWPEHGTKRTAPQDALSSAIFGDYYRNLTPDDCRPVWGPEHFSEFEISTFCLDLFFHGVKR